MSSPKHSSSAPHSFVPSATSNTLNCADCGESREEHWRKSAEPQPAKAAQELDWQSAYGALKTAHDEVTAELERVKQQRDELLEALKQIEALHYYPAKAIARAATAKHEGRAQS